MLRKKQVSFVQKNISTERILKNTFLKEIV